MTLFETFNEIVLKYNLVQYNYGSTTVYRFPFNQKYNQNGWLIRYIPLFNEIEICSSIRLDDDNTIIYHNNVHYDLYDPILFEKNLKKCHKITAKLKQFELDNKLERIKDDF
jgi:hypothetical protein